MNEPPFSDATVNCKIEGAVLASGPLPPTLATRSHRLTENVRSAYISTGGMTRAVGDVRYLRAHAWGLGRGRLLEGSVCTEVAASKNPV